ncbi:MAG: hypothetical protein FJ395_09880 [Verrucomicrobia bacterium]|nr:hypothetical protein [Verrucomicrobiota bacterium]
MKLIVLFLASVCAAEQWNPIWTRDPKAGTAAADAAILHNQQPSIRVEHRGDKDWSLTAKSGQIATQPGECWEISAWVKITGDGEASTGTVLRDKARETLSWSYGGRSLHATHDWTELRSRFIVPRRGVSIEPRVTGHGPATVWVSEFSCRKIEQSRAAALPATLAITNAALVVTLDTATATLSVLDRRTKQTWRQQAVVENIMLQQVRVAGGLQLDCMNVESAEAFRCAIKLDGDKPEFTVALNADGTSAPAFPHPFVTDASTYLVVPMNEGISYPVNDDSIKPMRLVAYGGHGICMAFWGATDGERGQMTIIETPDDASISIDRHDGKLCIAPRWDLQKGRFGYERKLRYVFFERGGHVAMCKRYRQTTTLKTLADKRHENPNVDLLVGAANIWCWDKDPVSIVKELKAAGIERILWSHSAKPNEIAAMNDLGVLTSRYDIYQDVMDPATFPKLRGVHGDWTTEAWPKDIMINSRGDWIRGWQVTGKDGEMYPCGVTCDKEALKYAEKRVPADLATHPYKCRFIDTTTASPWRECYAPAHPLTRSESRHWKMELLRLMSEKFKLVVGCETGHDAAVPFLHYFEGMLSLGPYRIPDAGRRMQVILDEVPERVAKFQVGERYRLPLWELVYHDCVIAQWYWGDYNNKLPAIWDKRDLFNVLYGTPPMFMFNRDIWTKNRDRFVQSYRAIAPVARATGYSEMTDHRFLTPDRAVQQTSFANGVTVTVNFGATPFDNIPAGGFRIAPEAISSRIVRP